jgi:hypothetical protein
VYEVPVTSVLSASDAPDDVPMLILYVLAPVLDQAKATVLLVMNTCCSVIVNELGAESAASVVLGAVDLEPHAAAINTAATTSARFMMKTPRAGILHRGASF